MARSAGAVPRLLYDHHLTAATPVWMGSHEGSPPAPFVDDHLHNGLEIGIQLSGYHQLRVGAHVAQAEPGDVWLCNLWEPHSYATSGERNSGIALIFLPEFVGDGQLPASTWLPLFTVAPAERLQTLSAETRAEVLALGGLMRDELVRGRPHWRELIRLHLLHLLLLLDREDQARQGGGAGPDPVPEGLAQILPAVSLVQAQVHRRISCAEAAGACGFSESHFRTRFRLALGTSFGWFSLRARLGYAAHLLATTSLSLRELADAAGFADASNLHHVFRKYFGQTPARYREQRRRGTFAPSLLPDGHSYATGPYSTHS